mmetsp:Transcript_30641/g.87941  ORF Transcript_30641/g.87941 Transcript_30641/m.87941 type:complete len:274 (-) Transcript_30641:18-839(-)
MMNFRSAEKKKNSPDFEFVDITLYFGDPLPSDFSSSSGFVNLPSSRAPRSSGAQDSCFTPPASSGPGVKQCFVAGAHCWKCLSAALASESRDSLNFANTCRRRKANEAESWMHCCAAATTWDSLSNDRAATMGPPSPSLARWSAMKAQLVSKMLSTEALFFGEKEKEDSRKGSKVDPGFSNLLSCDLRVIAHSKAADLSTSSATSEWPSRAAGFSFATASRSLYLAYWGSGVDVGEAAVESVGGSGSAPAAGCSPKESFCWSCQRCSSDFRFL